MGNSVIFTPQQAEGELETTLNQIDIEGQYHIAFINKSKTTDEMFTETTNMLLPLDTPINGFTEEDNEAFSDLAGEEDVNAEVISDNLLNFAQERIAPVAFAFQAEGQTYGFVFYGDEDIQRSPEDWMSLFSGINGEDLKNIPGTSQDWFDFAVRHEIGHILNPRFEQSATSTLDWETKADALSLTHVYSEAAGGLTETGEAFIAARAFASVYRAPTVFEDVDGSLVETFDLEHATNGLLNPDGTYSNVDPAQAMRELVELKTTAAVLVGYHKEYNDYDDFDVTPYSPQITDDLDILSDDGETILEDNPQRQYHTFKAMQEANVPPGIAAQKYISDYLEALEKYAPSLTVLEDPEERAAVDLYRKQAFQDLPNVYKDIQPLMRGFDANREEGPNFDPDSPNNMEAVVGENGPALVHPMAQSL